MSNCGFKLKVGEDVMEFDDIKALRSFLKNNYHRIKHMDSVFNVRFSKSGSDKFSESQAKIESIINESIKLTSEFNEEGERKITASGYTGVNRFMESARSMAGKQLVNVFDADNYVKNSLPKKIAELQSDPLFSNLNEQELQKEATAQLYNNVKEFKQLGKFGTELHYVSDLFYKDGVTEPHIMFEKIKEKFPDSLFTETVVENMLKYVKDTANELYKRHGSGAKIYSEFVVHDPETKIVGIIDLLVLDEDGNVHIYDYKTSHKKAYDWDNDKLNRMKYSTAFYNQLVGKKGLIANSINLLPINLSEVDYNTGVVKGIDTDQEWIDVTDAIKSGYYQQEANAHIPVTLASLMDKAITNDDIKKELGDAFGYSIQTNINIESFNIRKDRNGKEYFFNMLTGKQVYLDGTEEENQAKVDAYKKEYMASENLAVSQMKHNAKQYLSVEEDGKRIFYPGNDSKQLAFEKLLRPYKDSNWQIVEDDDLDALGIIAFQNTLTKTVDFISLTSNDIDSYLKLNKGKTILGNFYADRYIEEDFKLMKSQTKNIEALKVAMWMNSKADMFKSYGYNIGDIRIASTNLSKIDGVKTSSILYNYNKLCKETGIEYKLSGIKQANPYDILLSRVLSIIMSDEKLESYGSAKNTIKNIGKELEGQEVGKSFTENLSAEQIQDKLDELKKISESIRNIDKEKLDFGNEVHYLYSLVQSAIVYYEGLEVAYVDDIKDAAFNESRLFTSINNFANETIQMFKNVISRARSNINYIYNQFDTRINNLLLGYFREAGFTRDQQIIYGKTTQVYDNLWLKDDNGNVTQDFRLKDPRDGSLKEYEKRFLESFLEELNSYRYTSEEAISEAKLNGNYYKMPLIKVRGVMRLKQKGVWNATKESFINSIDFNNFFDEELADHTRHLKSMDSVYNQFTTQDNSLKRENMIIEHGVEEFEQDLQSIIKLYSLTHIRTKELNKILPVINAVRVTNEFKNAGLATKVTDHIDEFIKNYVKVNLFNEKLVEPHNEKWVRKANKVKELVSVALLGFNFSSAARDFLQGVLSNTIMTASKAFGYKISKTALLKAYGFLFAESKQMFNNITLIDEFNKVYGISMMDVNRLNERSMIAQNGLFTFRGEQMFAFNSLSDFYNRMSLFLAKMIEDGSLEAHRIINNKLVYDWKMDKRFNVYSKGPKYKDNPDYDKQRGLYLSLMYDFNKQKLTDKPLKEGDDLPQAYTYEDINSVKSFSNIIHGYYDKNDQIMFQHTWFGVAFMHFRIWLTAKKDQYLLSRNIYSIGERKQGKTPDGQLLWFKAGDNGESEVTTEETGVPYYPLEGSVMEGMLVSIGRFFKNVHESKYSIKEMARMIKEDKLFRSNMLAFSSNTLVYTLIMAMIANIDWPELQEDSPVLSKIAWTLSKSGEDLFIINNVSMITNPTSMIPIVSYTYGAVENISNLATDKIKASRAILNSVGMTRPFSGLLEVTNTED